MKGHCPSLLKREWNRFKVIRFKPVRKVNEFVTKPDWFYLQRFIYVKPKCAIYIHSDLCCTPSYKIRAILFRWMHHILPKQLKYIFSNILKCADFGNLLINFRLTLSCGFIISAVTCYIVLDRRAVIYFTNNMVYFGCLIISIQ